MKRNFWTIILSLVCILVMALCLTACKDKPNNGDGGDGDVVKVDGTYYYCENGVLDETLYITFKDGTWTDDEGQTGEYTLSEAKITLFVKIGNEKTEFASGTVDGDDVTLDIAGADWLYRKGPDIDPNKPKEKTLAYALSPDRSYYTVKGIGGLTGAVTVPDEYKKKPVTEIAENAFANCNDLTSIEIGANVTKIGQKAFYKCANLTGVVLGEKVGSIEESTFEECRKLETVTIPASVKSIAKKAFYFCLELKDVNYTGTASDWAGIDFYYHVGYNSLEISNPLSDNAIYVVGNNTASATHESRNLKIGGELLTAANVSGVDTVSPFAFYGYAALKSVTIGGSVAEIGEYAFYKCEGLTTLQFSGANLKKIDECAFLSCAKLQSVSLPDSVKRIEKQAFDSCRALTTATLGDGVTYIAYGAFMGCDNLSELTLGSSVAEICEAAFYNCEALTSVTIPSSTIFIGKDAFWATGLTSATFENKNGWIANKDEAISSEQLSDVANAAKLLTTSVLLKGYADTDWEQPTPYYTLSSDKTYYIVSNNGVVSRSEIVIPEKYNEKPVRALADYAFRGCKSLVSISLPYCMMKIPTSAFENCTSLESIEVRSALSGEFEQVYASSGGILYNADYSKVIYVPLGITKVTLNGSTIADGLFRNNTNLKQVVIGDNVTRIGESAFYNCSNLKSVTIGANVKEIGEYAFFGCELLTEIILPDGVTTIGRRAFASCYLLTGITIPASVTRIETEAFLNCSALTIYCEGAKQEWASNWNGGAPVVWNCKTTDKDENGYVYAIINGLRYSLKDRQATVVSQLNTISGDVVIPEKVTYKGATYSVTSIAEKAFYGNEGCTSITIPASITKIGSRAFSGCSNIEKIYYTGDLAGWCAFDNLSGLMAYSNATLYIGGKELVGELVLPANLRSLPSYAFYNCDKITSVTIPQSVGSISEGLFSGCTSLISVTILNDRIQTIFSSAFEGCSALTSINIPTDVTSIGSSAFKGCSSLTSLTLPNGLRDIYESTFEGCSSLKSLTLPNGIREIRNLAFKDCASLVSINIPSTVDRFGAAFEGCSSLTSIVIPDGITEIMNGTFNGCTSLTSVTIPSSVTKIEDAFNQCASLTSIKLPDGLTELGEGAFSGCSSLTSITIPGGVRYLGRHTFSGCTSLTDVVISEGVITIAAYAFYECSALTNVTIPSTVTSIGSYAFYECRNLQSIQYNGTQEEWRAISKSTYWNYNTGNSTVYCSDGEKDRY